MTGPDATVPVFEVRNLVKVFRGRGQAPQGAAGAGRRLPRRSAGEAIGIVGESGSGKTTLGRILIGLETATSGEVLYEGDATTRMDRRARRAFRARVQMVFQNPFSSLNPFRTVRSTLADGFRGAVSHAQSGAMRWCGSWIKWASTSRCSSAIRTSSAEGSASASCSRAR